MIQNNAKFKMIGQKFKNKLYKQDYSPKPKIDGVKLVDQPYFTDDGGAFCELFRLGDMGIFKEHFPDFELKQVNWSIIEPGLIKAGHLHKNQEDIWFVPPLDKVIVGLLDVREGSQTVNVKMRFVLGGGRARLLYIPRGVIHGCSNPYSRPMTILYLVNQLWSGKDEWRIDWRIFGDEFWEIARG